ncbi:hypothetical protein [Metabacillus fastidiosus]|uniref:Uncharacterized protein n=1 Tax=Metabacillus fastidiosus TaxID=1458 RepID=A0ABU6NUQ9_9BACI|nr:hypothetical protein [Metabacillus fastidiosus]MED4400348.1 hypothetical protein [Metabacillus fastidiosus]
MVGFFLGVLLGISVCLFGLFIYKGFESLTGYPGFILGVVLGCGVFFLGYYIHERSSVIDG